VACAGYKMFKGVVGLLGAIVLGGTFFIAGLWIGSFISGILGIVVAVVLGIIGAVLGAVLALTIATLMLSIGFGIISFMVGLEIGKVLGLSDGPSIVMGAAFAVVGGILFLVLARFMIKVATSVLGGYLTAMGSFRLIDGMVSMGREVSLLICLFIFILVTAAGYAIQSGLDHGDRGKDRERRKGRSKGDRRKR